MKRLGILSIVINLLFLGGVFSIPVFALDISVDTIIEAVNDTFVQAAHNALDAEVSSDNFMADFNAAYYNKSQPDFKGAVDNFEDALEGALSNVLGKSIDQIAPADIPSPNSPAWEKFIDNVMSQEDVCSIAGTVLQVSKPIAESTLGSADNFQLEVRGLVNNAL